MHCRCKHGMKLYRAAQSNWIEFFWRRLIVNCQQCGIFLSSGRNYLKGVLLKASCCMQFSKMVTEWEHSAKFFTESWIFSGPMWLSLVTFAVTLGKRDKSDIMPIKNIIPGSKFVISNFCWKLSFQRDESKN